jgi:hypothetical protein
LFVILSIIIIVVIFSYSSLQIYLFISFGGTVSGAFPSALGAHLADIATKSAVSAGRLSHQRGKKSRSVSVYTEP